MAESTTVVPAATRLRRLRLRLTLLYTAAAAIGLVTLAAVVTVTDAGLREDRMVAELHARAEDAGGFVWHDDETGRIVTSSIADLPTFRTGEPQVYVFDATGGPDALTVPFSPDRPWLPDLDPALVDLATTAVTDSTSEEDEARPEIRTDVDGATYAGVAHPVWGSPEGPVGAVVAVQDVADDQAAHDTLVAVVWIGSALLIAFAAGAGYLLAGRSILPAAAALDQQQRFLADAAHELRTPVAAIRAAAGAGLSGAEPADGALARVDRLSARTGDLVDDLLALARMEAGSEAIRREPLRLDQLVEDVVEDLVADPGAVAVATEPVTVDGDPRLLTRLVRNLVDNALTHGRGDDPTVAVGVRTTGRSLQVWDAGPGIPPDRRDALFERFRSGSSSAGSGLGLSIVDLVAAAHGAATTVADLDGHGGGTTVTVTFPDPRRVP